MLRPGRAYGEDELRDAVRRVERLPFVVDVEFRLRKGRERGHVVLVIEVVEATRFFAGFDLHSSHENEFWLESYDTPETRLLEQKIHLEDIERGDFVLGTRWFLGSRGVLVAALQNSEWSSEIFAQAGYTHYDLFGPGSFAALSIGVNDHNKLFGVEWGVPIRGNHSVRASYARVQGYGLSSARSDKEGQRDFLRFEWRYDTRDDPVLPLDGDLLNGGVESRSYDGRSGWLLWPPRGAAYDERSLWFSMERTRRIGRNVAWSWGGRCEFGELERSASLDDPLSLSIERGYWSVQPRLGLTVSLPRRKEGYSERHWATGLSVRRTGVDGARSVELEFSAELVYRVRWGIFRISGVYRDVEVRP